jgi:hypothetical protein
MFSIVATTAVRSSRTTEPRNPSRKRYSRLARNMNGSFTRQKTCLFDRMSKAWAHGSTEFMAALVEDRERQSAKRVLERDAGPEARTLLAEQSLFMCREILKKGKEDTVKSADWKVAVCSFLRQRVRCQSKWVGQRLNMGTEAGVSRCLRQLREGERPAATRSIEELKSNFKS